MSPLLIFFYFLLLGPVICTEIKTFSTSCTAPTSQTSCPAILCNGAKFGLTSVCKNLQTFGYGCRQVIFCLKKSVKIKQNPDNVFCICFRNVFVAWPRPAPKRTAMARRVLIRYFLASIHNIHRYESHSNVYMSFILIEFNNHNPVSLKYHHDHYYCCSYFFFSSFSRKRRRQKRWPG